MSVREEERPRGNSTNRGLGLAAAIGVGVGVGAALYYFLTKETERPNAEGATTSGWRCEEPQALRPHLVHCHTMSSEDDEYSTISEHSTTDTSVHDSYNSSEDETFGPSSHESNDDSTSSDTEVTTETDSDITETSTDDMSINTSVSSNLANQVINLHVTSETSYNAASESDTEIEWDVTNNSRDVPRIMTEPCLPPVQSIIHNIRSLVSPRRGRIRQRSWSLEECSICCEVMLKDQPLRSLPCTHNFHVRCLEPWIREHNTCPNCRKPA